MNRGTEDTPAVRRAKELEPEPTFYKGRTIGRDALSDGGEWWAEKEHVIQGKVELHERHAVDNGTLE